MAKVSLKKKSRDYDDEDEVPKKKKKKNKEIKAEKVEKLKPTKAKKAEKAEKEKPSKSSKIDMATKPDGTITRNGKPVLLKKADGKMLFVVEESKKEIKARLAGRGRPTVLAKGDFEKSSDNLYTQV